MFHSNMMIHPFSSMPASMTLVAALPAQTPPPQQPQQEDLGFCKPYFAASSHSPSSDTRLINKQRACFLLHHAPCLHSKRTAIIMLCKNNGLQTSASDLQTSTDTSDKKAKAKDLWEEFFSDPSQWWDNRLAKKSTSQPDFMHKMTSEALWIDSWRNPPWVRRKIANMAFDQIQSIGKSTPGFPAPVGNYAKIQKLTYEGRLKEALDLLEVRIQETSVAPQGAFVCLLKGCTRQKALEEGKQVHALIVRSKCDTSILLSNFLIDMYAACGSVAEALKVFMAMRQRNVVSWTNMIKAYTKTSQNEEAITLFQQMLQAGIEPNESTCITALKACAHIPALEQGKQLHSIILKKGFYSNSIVQNTLLNMYARCGCLKDARKVFDSMTERNLISWNALIAGYTQKGFGKEALGLYEEMNRKGMEPDNITLFHLLKACTSMSDLQQGKQLHSLILEKGLESNVMIQNALLRMYAKCGCLKDAHELFDKMAKRNVISWNALLAGYTQKGLGKEALDLYKEMKDEGVEPDSVTLVLLLKACASIPALRQGKQLHSLILQKGFQFDTIIQTTLVDMYAKCGCLRDARDLFDNMAKRNVISWNAMISGYAQKGLGKEALDLYEQMKDEGLEPDNVTLVLLLKACTSISALQQGKQLHSVVCDKGLESDITIQTTLIAMYAKCGCLKDARELFDNMAKRNVVSWNAMIVGYAQKGLGKEALDLYKQMKDEGMEPDNITLVFLLKACASISALQQGKQLHSLILEKGLENDMTLQSALDDMYATCGFLGDSHEPSDNLAKPSVITWNAKIARYAQKGFGKEALYMYEQMKGEGVEPDNKTYVLLLKACAHISALQQGKELHSLILEKGLESDMNVQNTLVDMYVKCGCLEGAREVFDNMTKRDVVSWNSIIAGYAKQGLGKEALGLYEQMKDEGMEPNNVTLLLLLKACASISALQQGKQLHSLILEKGFESNVAIQTTLVDMYAKCGCLEDARELFDNMSERNVISWNAMICGYAQRGFGKEALDLYEQMKGEGMEPDNVTLILLLKACASISALQQGKHLHSLILEKGFASDIAIQTTLIDMYAKCGCLKDARELFENMAKRNVISWNAMIAGYAQNGSGKEALDLYEQMKDEGLEPDNVTLLLLLKACASISDLQQGKQLHSLIVEKGFHSDILIQTTLVDMYAKCGCLKDARELFDNMAERNVISWNAMILGYAQEGFGKEALDLFKQMKGEGLQPDLVTYTCFLSACRRSGLVDEGRHVFESIFKDHDVTPTLEHYACIVDLLGRAGCLCDAEDLILKMPIQPGKMVWMSLLGACRKYFNWEIGRRAFDRIVELEPEDAAPYLLLIDIYSAAGRMDEVAQLRKEMNDRGLKEILECQLDWSREPSLCA